MPIYKLRKVVFITTDMAPAEIDIILAEKWIKLHDGSYLGPWKIFVYDMDLFRKVNVHIHRLFAAQGQEYPECIWGFYCQSYRSIIHPSREELENWIDEQEGEQ